AVHIMTRLIVSYDWPGCNITWITLGGMDLYGKRLEVLKEAVPRVAHVAFFVDPTSPGGGLWLKAMEPSAQVLGLQVRSFAVRSVQDFDSAFQAAIKWNAHGFIVAGDPRFTARRNIILNTTAK